MTKMNDYMKFIATSRYARWLPKEGRREVWEETVERYITQVVDKVIPCDEGPLTRDLQQAITSLEVMPSMRTLMTAGEAANRDNTCMYNCSYLPVDDVKSFDEAMFILMCGTGVGFSVERQYVSKLPEIPDQLFKSDTTVVVKDSKEGWSKSLRQVIALLYSGEIPSWDVSKVRPAGAKLKTFGGRASGPAPLVELFNFVVYTFQQAKGRKLSSIECHDIMCKIGEIVVVGGVRRSAMISLSNLSDDRMRHAKSGSWGENNPQRALANNSVAYTEKPDSTSFMREWVALAESGSGERGVFNRVASQKQAEKNGRRDPNFDFGTNPCCFTGDMKLLTLGGYVPFSDLVGRDSVHIVSSDGTISKGSVWSSGYKPTVFVNFHHSLGKDPIQVTDDHVFMLNDGSECQAKDLKGKRLMPFFKAQQSFVGGEGFLAGFMLGDANLNRLNSKAHLGLEVYFDTAKDGELSQAYGAEVSGGKTVLYTRDNARVAKEYGLPAKPIGNRGLPPQVSDEVGLQGLFSANGCVIKNSRVALKSIDRKQIEGVRSSLLQWGIQSYITTNKPKEVVFSNGEYFCKESYDLNINQYESILLFATHINFGQTYKREALEELIRVRGPYVSKVVEGSVEEVFDFTEPKNHWGVVEGVVVHNSEIILRPYQFCNLTEVVVRAGDTIEDLERKVRLATILGTIQSTYTHFPYLRKVWKKNTEEERLLGVSLTGIMDNPLMTTKNKGLEKTLEHLKNIAVATNVEWADIIGVPVSTAITCVKPSGTVSQLVDSASGIHPRYSPYYIRTVRGDIKDPLTQLMKDQGIPNEPCVIKPDTTVVFSFPQKAPEGAVVTSDISAIEQLETWLVYQRHWCEHKPSVTIHVKPDEWLEVGAFVYKHFDEMSGVSFLSYSGHTYQQAPYQEVSEGAYLEALSKMPDSIDWQSLGSYELEDNTVGMQTMACSGDVCEIVDLT